VPKVLAVNGGLDPIDVMVELRSAHEKSGGEVMGVDVFTGDIIDMHEAGVIEPLIVKEHAIKAASEAACLILRIDDIIAVKRMEMPPTPPGGPGGMPGGMGGMPPGY
jgi:chaperonin GroEL (HSP60 family)